MTQPPYPDAPVPYPLAPLHAAAVRRDELCFPAQMLIWSWRVLHHAYPVFGCASTRVARAHDIARAPAAFPAIHALVCLSADQPAGPCLVVPGHLGISGSESRLLSAIRHLQRGNDSLGRQALRLLMSDHRLELAMHYARIYANETAAAGLLLSSPGPTARAMNARSAAV